MAQEKITKGNEIKNLQVDEIKRISADQCNTIIDQKIEKVPNENDLNEHLFVHTMFLQYIIYYIFIM